MLPQVDIYIFPKCSEVRLGLSKVENYAFLCLLVSEIYLNCLLCLLVAPYISDATYFIYILHYTCRTECLKKHLPVAVPERLNELQIIAVRFEEKIYTAGTSQVI